MNRGRVWIVLVAALLVVPAAALAHRPATKSERTAILAAVVQQHQLSTCDLGICR